MNSEILTRYFNEQIQNKRDFINTCINEIQKLEQVMSDEKCFDLLNLGYMRNQPSPYEKNILELHQRIMETQKGIDTMTMNYNKFISGRKVEDVICPPKRKGN